MPKEATIHSSRKEAQQAPAKPEFAHSLEILKNINVPINIDMGNTHMSIREILDLEEGSIIEIQKSAGDNMEIKVKDVGLALGEIFVIEGSIGVRITEIQSDVPEY